MPLSLRCNVGSESSLLYRLDAGLESSWKSQLNESEKGCHGLFHSGTSRGLGEAYFRVLFAVARNWVEF